MFKNTEWLFNLGYFASRGKITWEGKIASRLFYLGRLNSLQAILPPCSTSVLGICTDMQRALMAVRDGKVGPISFAPATPSIKVSIRDNTIYVWWECQVSLWNYLEARRPYPEEFPTVREIIPQLPRGVPESGAQVLDWATGERVTAPGSLVSEVVYGVRFTMDLSPPTETQAPAPPGDQVSELLAALNRAIVIPRENSTSGSNRK